MQRHAVLDGPGALDAAGPARTINETLVTSFRYLQPQLAGGIATRAADYGDDVGRARALRTELRRREGGRGVDDVWTAASRGVGAWGGAVSRSGAELRSTPRPDPRCKRGMSATSPRLARYR